MTAHLLQFPERDVSDIPASLRRLADEIERGEFGDAHNLGWVIDCGNSRVELGMLGKAPEPATTAHFLYSLAQRKLEQGALDG